MNCGKILGNLLFYIKLSLTKIIHRENLTYSSYSDILVIVTLFPIIKIYQFLYTTNLISFCIKFLIRNKMRHGNFTFSNYNEFWILVTLFPFISNTMGQLVDHRPAISRLLTGYKPVYSRLITGL